MARKPVIEQVEMLGISNKEEITENFLKMIITFASVDTFIRKWTAASASFLFLFTRKIFF